MPKIRIFAALFCLMPLAGLFSDQPPVFPPREGGPPAAARAKEPLPGGYGPYTFGMERLKVLETVRKEGKLTLEDADFIEGFEEEDWSVLVAEGKPFFSNIFFLFHDRKLYGVVIVFDTKKYSYQLVTRTLADKYGRPEMLGHDSVIWQNDRVRLQLDQGPLLKYLDIAGFRAYKKSFDPRLLHPKLDKLDILKGL